MRSNPDALIKVVLTSPRRHHQLDNEYETQEPERVVDAEEYTTRERRRKGKMRNQSETQSRSPSIDSDNARAGPSTERSYPKILEDLSTTDEEEEKEIRELKREAKRMAREKRNKEKTIAKQKKARSFPLSKRFMSNERDTKIPSPAVSDVILRYNPNSEGFELTLSLFRGALADSQLLTKIIPVMRATQKSALDDEKR